MLLEYEFLTSVNLHKILKEKILGRMFVNIEDHTLKIIISNHDVMFKYNIENIDRKILEEGLTAEKIADIVVSKYKKFIFNKYFIEDRGGDTNGRYIQNSKIRKVL